MYNKPKKIANTTIDNKSVSQNSQHGQKQNALYKKYIGAIENQLLRLLL